MLTALFALAILQREPILPLLKAGDDPQIIKTVRSDPGGYLPEVLEALKRENYLIRERAAFALGELDLGAKWPAEAGQNRFDWDKKEPVSEERKQMIDALLESARDSRPSVREASVKSLIVVLRNRTWGYHGEAWSNRERLKPLIELGDWICPPILAVLDSRKRDRAVNVTVLEVLSNFRRADILEMSLKTMKDDDVVLATHSMWIAEKYDDTRVVPALLKNYTVALPDYGETAASVLMEMKARAVPGLIRLIQTHRDPATRRRAIVFLGHGRYPEAIPVLEKAAKRDPDPRVRAEAKQTREEYERPVNRSYMRIPD